MRKLLCTAALAAFVGAPPALAQVNIPALQGTITYKNSASTGPQYFSGFARATSKVVYDPMLMIYTIRDTGNPAVTSTFGPAQVTSSNATFTNFSNSSGSNVNTFRLFNRSLSNPILALTYVQYGQWRRSSTSSGVTSTNDTYVVFGTRTTGAAMPKTGGATYATYLDGTYVNKNGVYAVTGTGTLGASFQNGTITYSADLDGAREGGGTALDFGVVSGSGSLSTAGASFNGTGTKNGGGFKLDVNGHFYGPAAEEIGGIFRLTGSYNSVGGTGNGTGAIVGN